MLPSQVDHAFAVVGPAGVPVQPALDAGVGEQGAQVGPFERDLFNDGSNMNIGRAENYFNELIPAIPKEIAIIWTGPTVRSLSYDTIDFEKYTRLIGRKPMIWDNTLYARALESDYGGYAARMCNLFEPYDVYVPENFYQYVDGPNMYVNGSASSEFY